MPFNMQQNGSPAVRNIVLVALLVVSLVLVIVYAREGSTGPIHSVQNVFTGGSAAVGSVGSGLGSATESAGNSVADMTAGEGTLTALREQNQKLRQLLSDAEEAEAFYD